MNRFLTLASSSLIAGGLALAPVASFAQTGADAAKAPVTAPATTAAAPVTAPAAAAGATAKVATEAKPAGAMEKGATEKTMNGKTTAEKTATEGMKMPMHGKTMKHSAVHPKHHMAKAPTTKSAPKG